MNNFVITGKAKEVFSLIEAAAKYEKAGGDFQQSMDNLSIEAKRVQFNQCPFDEETRCDTPDEVCAAGHCKIYQRRVFGE